MPGKAKPGGCARAVDGVPGRDRWWLGDSKRNLEQSSLSRHWSLLYSKNFTGAQKKNSLAASIELLTRELHLPAELPLAQAVSAANAAVGLSAGGATLTQQVSALLEATGLRPTAHASMTPRSCLSTQTRPDYYKLLLEQKRRDGIL